MNYKIPLFDLNYDQEEEEEVIKVIRSRWTSAGPKTLQFETEFASMLGSQHAVALANCTVALHLSMVLCDIQPGDEVICPSLTFVATVNSIKYTGAVPVFADIKSHEDLTIDPEEIERKITAKTKAIVVMHYGGFASNMDKILRLAENHGLKVIEDACHAPMSKYGSRSLGTIGDLGCFSFFSNKNISTGEGGMLLTNDGNIAEKARLLRSHGMTSMSYDRARGHATSYDVVAVGYNYRMDDIRSAIGLVQLRKLKGDLIKRSLIRDLYINRLQNVPGISIPFLNYKEFSSNYIFPIVLEGINAGRRDLVREYLNRKGIQTSVHYPAVHRFEVYRDHCLELPNTEYVADNLITLPMYSSLSEENIDFITGSLNEALKFNN